MAGSSRLFAEFCDALNVELETLGCGLRIARDRPGDGETMLVVDATGQELGWVPDHIDAPSLLAFDRILQRGRPTPVTEITD